MQKRNKGEDTEDKRGFLQFESSWNEQWLSLVDRHMFHKSIAFSLGLALRIYQNCGLDQISFTL